MSAAAVAGDRESSKSFMFGLREHVCAHAPEVLAIFDEYAAEARFGREFLSDSFQHLPPGAEILEIGAGALMLSCMLAREGYNITAVEPVGDGFSHFDKLQSIVVDYARTHGAEPNVIRTGGESFDASNRFDYAFSVNVMEHVKDVARVLENVHASLKRGGIYRFICPNYAFPYEPHFNLPTLFSRKLTERMMSRRIMTSKRVVDPAGTWASLNWITVSQVRRICRARLGTTPVFDRGIFDVYLSRVLAGGESSERRGPFLVHALSVLRRLRITTLTALIPVTWLPVMDCRIERR